jgi:hypothetical protein
MSWQHLHQHAIASAAYHEGWARGGGIVSINEIQSSFDFKTQWCRRFGGPLFWAHYSYLGLDPNQLTDKYAIIGI